MQLGLLCSKASLVLTTDDKCYCNGLDKGTLWTGRIETSTGRLDQGDARAQNGQVSV